VPSDGVDQSSTIEEFCRDEKISRAYFYKLQRQGRGPRMMNLGPGAKRISPEARRDWRRQMEADASNQIIETEETKIPA